VKLVFVNTISVWGGGEKWTLDAAVELRRRGHDVSVLAADGGELLREAQEARLECTGIPSSWWGSRSAVARLRGTYVGTPPDLLLANTVKDVRLANRVRPRGRDIPLIFRRGLDKPISNHLFHRRSVRQAHTILANSQATRETMCASFPWFDRARMVVIYNPVDTERFLSFPGADVRGELGLQREAFVTAIVGRLVEQKGHETFLKAFANVLAEQPAAVALIVGDGELLGPLRALAEQLGLRDAARFTGQVKVVQPYYDACDVVAIPSLYEGFCFTALEAQLMAKPVVASDTSSLPEIVKDETTGFLVPPGDPDALADRLLQLARSTELRKEMGEAGRQAARERFDASQIYDELESLFERVVESESRSS